MYYPLLSIPNLFNLNLRGNLAGNVDILLPKRFCIKPEDEIDNVRLLNIYLEIKPLDAICKVFNIIAS
jgi:hypothetical protein